jgi:hypothetical protein
LKILRSLKLLQKKLLTRLLKKKLLQLKRLKNLRLRKMNQLLKMQMRKKNPLQMRKTQLLTQSRSPQRMKIKKKRASLLNLVYKIFKNYRRDIQISRDSLMS